MSGPFDGVSTLKGAIKSVTKRYAICPHCGKDSGKQIDHLYQYMEQGKPVDYKNWDCEECGLPMTVREEAGELVIGKDTNPRSSRMIKTWDLVEVITKDGKRLRLLLNQKRWEKQGEPGVGEPECPQEVEDHKSYWYNEGTCPTNWTSGIEAVIEENDEDPHGAFQFVASVDQDKAIYKPKEARSNLDDDEELDFQATFPEHFKPLEPEPAKDQLLDKLPVLLIEMLRRGQEVAVRLVKDAAHHGETPVRYVIETKEIDKDGKPDSTRYGITISSKLGETFMSFRKPKEGGAK